MKGSWFARRAAAAAAASLAFVAPAAGQVRVWTGAVANNDWNTAGNWNPAGVPNSAGQSAVFSNAGFGTVNVSGNVQTGAITFDTSGAGSFNLTSSAGRTLTVANITVAPGVTETQTINLANIATGSLVFAAGDSLTITNNAAATAVGSPTLVIGPNTVIGSPGTGGLVVSGTGTTLFTGTFASSGAANFVDGGLTKTGSGVLTLAGNNANLGGTGNGGISLAAAGGMLNLDYAASNTNKIGTGGLLLAGGDVTLLAALGAAVTQTVAGGTSVAGGHSAVLLNTNGGALTSGLTLNLNALTRSAGGTVDITAQPFSAATTTTTTTNGILGGYATVNGGATWATKTGSTIVGLTSFGANSYTPGTNTDVTANASFVGGFTTNSLRFNTVVAGGLSVNTATASVVQSGGILLTPTSGGVTITGGSLSPSAGGELIIHQYSPASAGLTIDSSIFPDAGLTKTGPGLLTLGGTASDLNGPVNIHRGSLRLTRTSAVGGSTGLFFNDTRSGNQLQTLTVQLSDGQTDTLSHDLRFSATSAPGVYANVLSTGASLNSRVTLSGVISSAPGAATTPIMLNGATGDTSGFNLTGANTFRGDVRLENGILGIDDNASLGDPANKLSMSFNLTGGLEFLNGGVNVARPVDLAGQVRIHSRNAEVNTISGVISGINPTAAPVKEGTGTLVLSGANTFDGAMQINAGTLRISAGNNLGLGTGSVWVNQGGTLAADETFSLGRGLQVGPDTGPGTGTVDVAATKTLTIASIVSNRLSGTGALLKTGPGTLTLTNAGNLYSGGTTVRQGTLRVTSNGALGPANTPVVVEPLGTLAFASGGTTVSNRTFELDGGTLAVATGSLQLNNGAVIGSGAITGPGTLSTAIGSSNAFAGGTTTTLANLSLQGVDTFTNFSQGGQLTVTGFAVATLTRVTNTSSGRMTINGFTNVSEFVSDGSLTVEQSGQIANTAADLVLGGGSTTFVGSAATPSGTINLGGQTLQLRGGLLVNNGAVINGGTVVDFGGLAKGAGSYDSVTTINGGRFSPGNSPGRATVGTLTLGPGGRYEFEIGDAADPGGWDLTRVRDALQLTATPEQPFTLGVVSLLDGAVDVPGAIANFDPSQSYAWLAFDVSAGGTLQFDPSAVVVDASQVRNAFGGVFGLERGSGESAQQVFLTYSPSAVPEPSAPQLLASAAAATGVLTRRRRRSAAGPKGLGS